MREYLDEARNRFGPIVEDPFGTAAAGQFHMARDEIFYQLQVLLVKQRFEIDRIEIAAFLRKVSALIVNVGDATTHTGREISAARAENHNQSVGHVFATVIADTFNDGGCSRVANCKALAGNTVEESFAAGRSIERNIADDDVLFRSKGGTARRHRR